MFDYGGRPTLNSARPAALGIANAAFRTLGHIPADWRVPDYRGWMPHDLTLKAMNLAHRVILAVSGNRLGWRIGSMPVVELTTTGRRRRRNGHCCGRG